MHIACVFIPERSRLPSAPIFMRSSRACGRDSLVLADHAHESEIWEALLSGQPPLPELAPCNSIHHALKYDHNAEEVSVWRDLLDRVRVGLFDTVLLVPSAHTRVTGPEARRCFNPGEASRIGGILSRAVGAVCKPALRIYYLLGGIRQTFRSAFEASLEEWSIVLLVSSPISRHFLLPAHLHSHLSRNKGNLLVYDGFLTKQYRCTNVIQHTKGFTDDQSISPTSLGFRVAFLHETSFQLWDNRLP